MKVIRKPGSVIVINPYADISWDAVSPLHSVNHMHTFSANVGGEEWNRGPDHQDGERTFQSMYDLGIRHFPLANYHPSKPTYPLEDYFAGVPADAIGCPNAETSVSGERGHYCTIGSFYDSREDPSSTWRELFDHVFEQLAYEGGGGIVINHPKRTGLSLEAIIERFDADPRVLGIEAYNHRCEYQYGGTGDARSIWDELLMTGRPVLGFFNPDFHCPWDLDLSWSSETLGRNVLLVEQTTESAAANAYRAGHTYGALRGSGLEFSAIEAGKDDIAVTLTDHATIEFISDRAVVETVEGSTATYDFNGKETYVRVEASDDSGEKIFSQAIVFEDRTHGGEERHT